MWLPLASMNNNTTNLTLNAIKKVVIFMKTTTTTKIIETKE